MRRTRTQQDTAASALWYVLRPHIYHRPEKHKAVMLKQRLIM